MTPTIKWCCVGFEAAYQAAGERSIAVLIDEDDTGPEFFLQARAFDKGEEPHFEVEVPMSLVTEQGLRFCPWCGTSLVKWYARHAKLLKRPDLRVEKQ